MRKKKISDNMPDWRSKANKQSLLFANEGVQIQADKRTFLGTLIYHLQNNISFKSTTQFHY
jgi:hypothetical protein